MQLPMPFAAIYHNIVLVSNSYTTTSSTRKCGVSSGFNSMRVVWLIEYDCNGTTTTDYYFKLLKVVVTITIDGDIVTIIVTYT